MTRHSFIAAFLVATALAALIYDLHTLSKQESNMRDQDARWQGELQRNLDDEADSNGERSP